MHKAIMQFAHVRHDMKATLTLNVLKVCNFFVECVMLNVSLGQKQIKCILNQLTYCMKLLITSQIKDSAMH